MDMFNEQQDAANSPGGVAPSGDQHTDSPENSGGGESTPIQFLLMHLASDLLSCQSVLGVCQHLVDVELAGFPSMW